MWRILEQVPRFCAVAAALLPGVIACSGPELPPVVAEGECVRIRHDDRSAVCAGTVHYFDAIAKEFYTRFGREPDDDALIDYVWTSPDGVGGHCPVGSACSKDDRKHDRSYVFADELPQVHEMVHAARYRVWPQPAAVLDEGLAESWGAPTRNQRWPDGVSVADLFPAVEGAGEYEAAHHLVHGTIDEFGWDAFEDLWFGSKPGMSLEEFDALYLNTFGTSLEMMLEARSSLLGCVRPTCVGEPLSPEGGTYSIPLPLDCAEETTIGRDPTGPFPPLRRVYVLQGHAPAWYRLQVPAEPNQMAVVFEKCDSVCFGEFDKLETDGYAPDEVYLEEGAYQVTIKTDTPSQDVVVVAPRD